MNRMIRFYLIIALFLPLSVFGQKKYTLSFVEPSYQHFIKHPKTEFKDSLQLLHYLNELQILAISKGYALASVDSILFEQKKVLVDFSLGPKLEGISVQMLPEELQFVRKNSRINEKIVANIAFTPTELARTLTQIQKSYLNNGYPFVQLQLINHEYRNTQFFAELKIQRGEYYTWTQIHVKGDSSISAKYISNLLDIREGNAFSELQVQKISSRIEQIPFVQEVKPAELLFTKDGVELFLYLTSVPVSSVNGIIGFQPNPATQKLSFTGEITLKLLNILRRGELLDLKWQSIRDQTQSLNARLNYPFLFNTPFGIDASLDLYKRDTSFLELNTAVGVQYFLSRGSYLKAFYSFQSSDVLSGGPNNPLFSNLRDVKSNNYGISYSSSRVDYLPNPSRGYTIDLGGTVGSRKSQISDTSAVDQSLVYRTSSRIQLFLPITKRHVIKLASVTDTYTAEATFENEVYRYGGLGSQRGFNEEELFATTRWTVGAEYRFLLDRNSHVFAFYDQSWYENNSNDYYKDSPFGFGAGFSFSTNFGVFSISYALGKQFNNPIQLSNSKVHFGYIAYF